MENFFGGLLAGKSSKLSGSGQNPTAIGDMGGSLARVKAKMALPTEISAQQVVKLEQELGQVDAELELGKLIVQQQEQLLNKAVDLHDVNTQWANVTMKADQRMRTIEGKHKQQVAQYTLGAARTQAYTDGYVEAYQISEEIFG